MVSTGSWVHDFVPPIRAAGEVIAQFKTVRAGIAIRPALKEFQARKSARRARFEKCNCHDYRSRSNGFSHPQGWLIT